MSSIFWGVILICIGIMFTLLGIAMMLRLIFNTKGMTDFITNIIFCICGGFAAYYGVTFFIAGGYLAIMEGF